MPKKLPDILLRRRTVAISAEWHEVMEDLTSALKLVDRKVRCDVTVATGLGWLVGFVEAPSKVTLGRDTSDRMRISLVWIAKRIEDTVKTDQKVITFNESEFANWRLQSSSDAKEAVNVPMSSFDSVSVVAQKPSAVPERQLAEAKSKKAAASEKKSSVPKASSKKALPDLHPQVPVDLASMAVPSTSISEGTSDCGLEDNAPEADSESGEDAIEPAGTKGQAVSVSPDERLEESDLASSSPAPGTPLSKSSRPVGQPENGSAVPPSPSEKRATPGTNPSRAVVLEPGMKGLRTMKAHTDAVLTEMADSGQEPIATLATQLLTLIKTHRSRPMILRVRHACAGYQGKYAFSTPGAKSLKIAATKVEHYLRTAIEIVNRDITPAARVSVEGWLADNSEALRVNGFDFRLIYGRGGKPLQAGTSVAVKSTPSSSGPQQPEDTSSDPVGTVQKPIDENQKPPPVYKTTSKKAKKLASRVGVSTRSTRVVRKTARVKRTVTRRSKQTSSTPVEYAITSADQAAEVKSSCDVPPEQVEMISQAVENAEEIHRLHRGQPRVDNNTIGSGTGATTPRGYEAVAKRERRIKLAKEAQQAATARREFG